MVGQALDSAAMPQPAPNRRDQPEEPGLQACLDNAVARLATTDKALYMICEKLGVSMPVVGQATTDARGILASAIEAHAWLNEIEAKLNLLINAL